MSYAAAPQTAHPLEIQARVSFGVAAEAFTLDVDLALPGHGVTAFFGPSGCGKTTLLRAVAGLERPNPGRIKVSGDTWQDDDANTWLPTHQRPLGYVFQEASLFSHLSVQGNLDFGLKRVPAGERRIALDQAIELLGIGHLLSRRPAQLSGGERQRVAIARALATSPRLLLMDEPLAALDAARKAELLPYFERLQRELALPILYVSHSLDEVARLATHLVLLSNGRVQATGATSELLTRLDLPLAHGDNASAVIEGEVTGLDIAWDLLQIRFTGGMLQCVHAADSRPRPIGARLRVRVLARDVSLALTPAHDTSVLNVLPATVRAITPDGSAQALVTLDAGGTTLLARVTRKSADILHLAVGQTVFAQIKAVAVLN
ncbi:molybdenum ABC transporter ATP-binding protein [Ottowia thiooxydans]|uniref:molybdenum ABC transporter ATP-binding protein n=1 Tax=Ottowia thiooxydans TaxID=219182 RepID=UPI000410D3B2|nr:molybdenum ABC transporter ATP-binding protein [Ottowia thiooxydans]